MECARVDFMKYCMRPFHSALHTFVISNKVLHALQQIVLSSYRFSMPANTPRDDIKVVADRARESSSKGLPGDMTFEVKIADVNDWLDENINVRS
jgi:hypothetical protein